MLRAKFERRVTDEPPDQMILTWLTIEKEAKTMKQIREFLKDSGRAYVNMDKNRSGLVALLKRLLVKKKIKKLESDLEHRYPRYTAIENTTFGIGLDGNLFRTESTSSMFRAHGLGYGQRDIEQGIKNEKSKLTRKEKQIETLVTYMGIQMLYTILTSYERPINNKLSSKKNAKNRDTWLKNALSYHEPDIGIIDLFERIMVDYGIGEYSFENKKLLNDVSHFKKLLCNMYPHISKNMKDAESILEDVTDAMRDSYLDIPKLSKRILE